MPETQTKREPPKDPPPSAIATSFADEPIKEIGERIMGLPKCGIKKLLQYLTTQLEK